MNVTKSTSLLSSLGAATLLLLAGCGTKLDMSIINKSISDGLASQLGLADAVVTCPQEAPPAKAGGTFECEAKPKDGGRLVLQVTQKDDKGNIAWELVKIENMINLKTAEEAITAGIKEQTGTDVTVSCNAEGGSNLRPAKAGETFECQAVSADGSATPVLVTMKDNEGNIAWAIEPSEDAAEESSETSEPEEE